MSMDVILPIDELIFFKMVIAPPTSTPGARRCTTGLRLTGRGVGVGVWGWGLFCDPDFMVISWGFKPRIEQVLRFISN